MSEGDREVEEGNGQRRFSRFPIEGTVQLHSARGNWQTDLVDISLKGLLVNRPKGWIGEVGDHLSAEVQLVGGIEIGMDVTTVHLHPREVGLKCDRIDFDSFTRLKRLIELNLGASELLNRELSALG